MTHSEEEEPGAAPPHGPAPADEAAWKGFAQGAPAPEAEHVEAEVAVAPEPAPARVTPPAAHASQVAPARSGAAPWLSLVLFAVLAAGLFWVWSHPRTVGDESSDIAALQRDLDATKQGLAQLQSQSQSDTGLAQQVQALAARVDQLEKQAQALPAPQPQTDAQAAAPAGNTDELGHRMDDLAGRVAALEQRPVPSGGEAAPQPAPEPQAGGGDATTLKPSLDALAARVSRLEHGAGNVESVAQRAARVAQAESGLAALDAGRPLGPIPGAPPEVARFATEAPPTLASLRAAFPEVAERIRAAMEPTGPNQTFFGRALARLERGITVREGDRVVVGAPQEAVLERAEDDVHIDDLTAAVTELGKLTGKAREAAFPWLEQAQAVLGARAALAQMAARG